MAGLLRQTVGGLLAAIMLENACFADDGTSGAITLFELGYAARHWNANDGLPVSDVRCMEVGPEGYLWIGTDGGGLARFNGHEFTRMSSHLPPEARLPKITDMLFQASGTRWMAGIGGPQVRIEGDHIQTFDSEEGAAAGIWSLTEGPKGDVWGARTSVQSPLLEILRFDEDRGRFTQIAETVGRGIPRTLEFDSRGRLWGTLFHRSFPGGEKLYHLLGDRIEPVLLPGETGRSVLLFRRRNGGLALIGGLGIYELTNDKWVLTRQFPEPLPTPLGLQSCVQDDAGNIWLATSVRGLWACPPGGTMRQVVPDSFGFPSSCRTLFIGPSGNIWIGTEHGLFQLFRSHFLRAPASERIRPQSIRGIGEDGEGTLWLAGHNQVYHLRPGGAMAPVAEPESTGRKMMLVGRRNEPGAWLSHFRGRVLKQLVDGRTDLTSVPGMRRGFVRDMVETNEALWISYDIGLYQYHEGNPERDQPAETDAGPTAVADGENGILFAGFDPQGLFRHEDGNWKQLVGGQSIHELAADRAGGAWAIVGRDKLGWFHESSWLTAPLGDLGVPHQSRIAMVCSEDGAIWLQPANNGVIRFDRHEVERWLSSECREELRPRRQQFGLADGLPSEHATAYPFGDFRRQPKPDLGSDGSWCRRL